MKEFLIYIIVICILCLFLRYINMSEEKIFRSAMVMFFVFILKVLIDIKDK